MKGSLKLQSRRYRYLLRTLNVDALCLDKRVFKTAASSLQVPLPKSYRVLTSPFFHWGERVFKTAVSSLQVPSPNSKCRRSSAWVKGSLYLDLYVLGDDALIS